MTGRNWSSKGSEIKVKCNGERVPPTVLMSSGRVSRIQGKTAGWSVSSHSFLSVSVPPLGDVNLGFRASTAVAQNGKSMIGRICICVACTAFFSTIAKYRERSQTIYRNVSENWEVKKMLPCILRYVC